jgi:hypothetical protein
VLRAVSLPILVFGTQEIMAASKNKQIGLPGFQFSLDLEAKTRKCGISRKFVSLDSVFLLNGSDSKHNYIFNGGNCAYPKTFVELP